MENSQPDVYDEEFFNNLKLARTFMTKMVKSKDKTICRKWIQKVCALKSDDVVVKKNRNAFFKFMLTVLAKAAELNDLNPNLDSGDHDVSDRNQFTSRWSKDNRTYVACKPLPGKGAMVYLAVTAEPSLGWDHPET